MKSSENASDQTFVLKNDLSPSEIVRLRCESLREGRFDLIYDSTHADSNFRDHFHEKQDYLLYAASSLTKEIRLIDYSIQDEQISANEALVLFFAEFMVRAERHKMAEVAHMRLTPNGWRYLYGEKVRFEDLPSPPNALTVELFETLKEKTIF